MIRLISERVNPYEWGVTILGGLFGKKGESDHDLPGK